MPTRKELTQAVAAHGMWRNRLRQAIRTGKSDVSADQAAVDDACDFGRWLRAVPESERSSARHAKVVELHLRFHLEAAAVVRLAEGGRTAEALEAIATGSAFDQATAALTLEMMDWLKSV